MQKRKTAERSGPSRNYAPGLDTRQAIVRAAVRILMREGHQAITFAAVAKEADIASKGHVQYHFPTRQDLIEAVSDYTVERHRRDYEKALRDLVRAGDASSVAAVVEWHLDRFADTSLARVVLERTSLPWLRRVGRTAAFRIQENSVAAIVAAYGIVPGTPESEACAELFRLLGVVLNGVATVYGIKGRDDPDYLAFKKSFSASFVPELEKRILRALDRLDPT